MATHSSNKDNSKVTSECSNEKSELKKVGFWSLEDVTTCIDPTWWESDPLQVGAIIWRLDRGSILEVSRDKTLCKLCHCRLGSAILTDGVWIWPKSLEHYIMCHSVKPPQEFIDYMELRVEEELDALRKERRR